MLDKLNQLIAEMRKRLAVDAKPKNVAFQRKHWEEFAHIKREDLPSVRIEDLVKLSDYRKDERTKKAGGLDPLEVFVAYAQDEHIYDRKGRVTHVDKDVYARTPVLQRVNKFKLCYRPDAQIWLHKDLADILVDAAIELYNTHKWRVLVYDGLRTVEGAYLMYHHSDTQWLKDGLLADPGFSAHNRGMAVDWMMIDDDGREIPVGAHFDHPDMKVSHRDYDEVGHDERKNRIIRETVFQRAAIKRGTVVAPLVTEFWDDRFPRNEEDLASIIESLARTTGQGSPHVRASTYQTFSQHWKVLNRAGKLTDTYGPEAAKPPQLSKIIFYGRLNPLYDRDLPEQMRLAAFNPASISGIEKSHAA